MKFVTICTDLLLNHETGQDKNNPIHRCFSVNTQFLNYATLTSSTKHLLPKHVCHCYLKGAKNFTQSDLLKDFHLFTYPDRWNFLNISFYIDVQHFYV